MDVVFAKYTATVVTPDGAPHTVRRGEYWPPGDPVVAAAPPDMFTGDPRYGTLCYSVTPPEMSEAPVEQATAAPGEKRAAVRRG